MVFTNKLCCQFLPSRALCSQHYLDSTQPIPPSHDLHFAQHPSADDPKHVDSHDSKNERQNWPVFGMGRQNVNYSLTRKCCWNLNFFVILHQLTIPSFSSSLTVSSSAFSTAFFLGRFFHKANHNLAWALEDCHVEDDFKRKQSISMISSRAKSASRFISLARSKKLVRGSFLRSSSDQFEKLLNYIYSLKFS